jgi:ABC-2 type transport system permease protein
MISKIIKHEWRVLAADASLWIVVAVFAFAVGGAILNGLSVAGRRQESIRRFALYREAEIDNLRRQAEEEERQNANRNNSQNSYEFWGPRHPFRIQDEAGHLRIIAPPPPLAALAVGQSDLFPVAYSVSTRGTSFATQEKDSVELEQIENPLKLLTGHFDLSFVFVYLYPLLILAFSYNLIGAEKEAGTLALLLSQPVGLRAFIGGKIAARAAVIFGCAISFSLAGFLLSGVDLATRETVARLGFWLLAVVFYGAFWFGLAVLANAAGVSSAANALRLAVCWLSLVIVIPSLANLAASAFYPIPSRAEFILAKRNATANAKAKSSQLMGKFFEDHPELALSDEQKRLPLVELAAQDEEAVRQLRPVRDRFDTQLQRQQRLIARCRFLSPALLFQNTLDDIAGSGPSRHQHLLSQAARFYEEWKGYFQPKIFSDAALYASEYQQIPRFVYQEESLGGIIPRLAMPLLTLGALSFVFCVAGLRAHRRYRVLS